MPIQGGPYIPYPRLCPQDCYLGPKYAQSAGAQTAPLKYPVINLGSSSGCTADAIGNYPPCPIFTTSAGGSPYGIYYPGFYNIVGDTSSGPVPAITWLGAQAATAISITAGGSHYVTGDIGKTINPSIGSPGLLIRDGTAMQAQITNVAGGQVTGARIVTGGQYLNGHIPGGYTEQAGTMGTGATYNISYGQAYVDFSVCEQRGFKSVAVGRNWHGIFGFMSRQQSGLIGTVPGSVCFTPGIIGGLTPVGFTGVAIGGYVQYPNDTKYLRLNITVTTTTNISATGPTYSGTYISDFSVNPNSGENTLNSSSSTYTGPGTDYCLTRDPIAGTSGSGILDYIQGVDYNGLLTSMAQSLDNVTGAIWTGTLASYAQTSIPYTVQSGGVVLNSGGFTATINFYNTGILIETWSVSLTDTLVSYTYTSYDISSGTSYVDYTFTATATLSTPNTGQSVYNDAVALLAYWNLADNMQYPWRIDGYPAVAPLMSRNELGAQTPLVSYNTASGWVDPNCNVVIQGTSRHVIDGSILGAPNPAGYQGYFCYQFRNYTGSGSSLTLSGYGSDLITFVNTGIQIPLNSTQWTDGYFVALTPPGPSMNYKKPNPSVGLNNQYDLQMVKYAEVGEQWSAENWGRPGGYDKFAIDETKVICSGGGTFASAIPTTGLYVYVVGSAIQGIYQLTSGATSVSGSPIYQNPSDWWSNYSRITYPDSSDFVAPLRWQGGSPNRATAPSLLGRIGVTLTSGTGPYTYTLANPQTNFALLISGGTQVDQVDVWDKGMNALASNVTATRVDDSNLTLVSSYPTAAWVTIHGAPTWYFNSSYPRGNYATYEWIFNFRVAKENSRIGTNVDCSGTAIPAPSLLGGVGDVGAFVPVARCLPLVNCAPKVYVSTPNSTMEFFTNGVHDYWPNYGSTYGAAGYYALDEPYGSQYAGQVAWTMTSYFWQAPHKPAAGYTCDGNTLQQDDGSCATTIDGLTVNYGLETIVECEITVPEYGPSSNIPPTLPFGMTTLAPVDPTASINGIMPPIPGSPAGAWTVRNRLLAGNAACYNYSDWVTIP